MTFGSSNKLNDGKSTEKRRKNDGKATKKQQKNDEKRKVKVKNVCYLLIKAAQLRYRFVGKRRTRLVTVWFSLTPIEMRLFNCDLLP